MRTLADCEVGEVVKIVDMHGCRLAKRLAAMGLRVGDTVKVVSKLENGPLVVEHTLHGNRIAIGRGMAEKIYVL
ncbi:MAG: FeoA family protein [Archaeoglobaceae archaeon]